MLNPFETMMTTVAIKPMVRAVRKPKVEVKPYAGSDEEREVKLAKAAAAFSDAGVMARHGQLWVNKLWVVKYDEQFAKEQVA